MSIIKDDVNCYQRRAIKNGGLRQDVSKKVKVNARIKIALPSPATFLHT